MVIITEIQPANLTAYEAAFIARCWRELDWRRQGFRVLLVPGSSCTS